MKTIEMKLNREPSWLTADEEIEHWEREGFPLMVHFYKEAKRNSLLLRDKIIEIVEREDQCRLYWEGVSRPMHKSYARKWAEVLPEYDFEIRGFKCIVRKKGI